MAMFGMNDIYGSVPGMPRRPWQTPGYGDQFDPTVRLDPQTQQAVDQDAALPAPKKSGGMFGGGFGNVLKTVLSGAMDGVARYYGMEPGGYNTAKAGWDAQAEAASAQQKLIQQMMLAKYNSDLGVNAHAANGAYDAAHPAPTELQQQHDYLVSIGRPDLANSLVVNKASAPPIVQNNGNGTMTVYPQGLIPRAGTGGGPAIGQVVGSHKYIGGDPNSPQSWQPVNASPNPGVPGMGAATLTREQYRGLVAGLGSEQAAQAYLQRHGITVGGM